MTNGHQVFYDFYVWELNDNCQEQKNNDIQF